MNPKVSTAIRLFFALFILAFGFDKFFHFIPVPPLEGDGAELMRIYGESGFLKMIGVLQIGSAIALFTNKFIPLALTILLAIMFNAFVFHILHDLEGIGGSVIGLILDLLLVYDNKDRFSSLLSA